jgi:hypothetical protein
MTLAANIWSSPGAIKPFVLTDSMTPPGSTTSTATGGVAIHGLKGTVSYRLQPGGRQILVANKPDLTWPDLTLKNSWTVGCWTHVPTGTPHCDVTLLQTSKTKSLTGVSIIDDKVCPNAGLDPAGFAYATLLSGGGLPYRSEARQTEAMHCLNDADSANALTEMLNEPRFYVFRDPYEGQGTEVLLFPFGLREALSMRDWLKTQMMANRSSS